MIFKRFLSRRTRLATPEDQDALIQIVRTDRDNARRLEACRLITELHALREFAAADVDAGIREIAQARYRRLLCGQDEHVIAPTVRIGEIGKLDDQRSLEQVAVSAVEPEVRLAAIQRLTDPTVLAACALNDRLAANRNASVARLDDKPALEQVVRRIGKRDKQVYRIARHKLREIADREALPERMRSQCEAICDRVERLGRFGHWVQDRALLDILERQWSEIASHADQGWRRRYEEGKERFLAAYEVYRNENEAQIAEEEAQRANRAIREGLIEELEDCKTLYDEGMLAERLERIEARWKELAPLPEEILGGLERGYLAAKRAAESHLAILEAKEKAARRLARLGDEARQLLEQSKPVDSRAVRRIIDTAGPLRSTQGIDGALLSEFDALRERLEDRLGKQVRHAEQRLTIGAEKLKALEEAVESGELKRAEPVFQSLQSSVDLARTSGLPHKRYCALSDGLRALAPRLRELQKWRRWGADTHREGLCQAMEKLVQEPIPLEAKALRLHDLQMEWKDLDSGGSPVNHPLWERFHAASDQVYACCKPYLERQAAERKAARAAREDLCQQLEDFLDQVDWERVGWKRVLHAEREIRRGWAELGEVDGRLRRQLEKRFRAAMKRLDDRLNAEREQNQAWKRELVARVESLAEHRDLDRAIEETKQLQREWRTTVPARQKEENRLWQEFRSACDAVFARRREQAQAFTQELDENLKTREAICADAESLAGAEIEPSALVDALRDIETRWHDTETLQLPRRAAGGLERRWRAAKAQVEHRRLALLDERRQASLDLLARQAAVCERLERAVEADQCDESVVDTAQSAWQALPHHPADDLQEAIASRYGAARQAAGGSADALRAQLAENARRRAELCVQLEILAQVDSPPEAMQQRLAFQVARLKEHMRAGERDPLSGAAGILEGWYLCGPAPVEQTAALEERFARARQALPPIERETEAA